MDLKLLTKEMKILSLSYSSFILLKTVQMSSFQMSSSDVPMMDYQGPGANILDLPDELVMFILSLGDISYLTTGGNSNFIFWRYFVSDI
jgi:hypothetical protein